MSHTVFEKSKWIWVASGECPDQYVEFCERISYRGGAFIRDPGEDTPAAARRQRRIFTV